MSGFEWFITGWIACYFFDKICDWVARRIIARDDKKRAQFKAAREAYWRGDDA